MFSKLIAKAKKEMPIFLLINACLWALRIVSEYDGTLRPVLWAVFIALTTILTYVVFTAIVGALKFVWSLLRRIPGRRALPRLDMVRYGPRDQGVPPTEVSGPERI